MWTLATAVATASRRLLPSTTKPFLKRQRPNNRPKNPTINYLYPVEVVLRRQAQIAENVSPTRAEVPFSLRPILKAVLVRLRCHRQILCSILNNYININRKLKQNCLSSSFSRTLPRIPRGHGRILPSPPCRRLTRPTLLPSLRTMGRLTSRRNLGLKFKCASGNFVKPKYEKQNRPT